MGKKTFYIYSAIILLFLALLFYIGITFSVEIYMPRSEQGFEKVSNWTREIFAAGEEGADRAAAVYHIRLPEKIVGKEDLVIYTIHQNISVRSGRKRSTVSSGRKGGTLSEKRRGSIGVL